MRILCDAFIASPNPPCWIVLEVMLLRNAHMPRLAKCMHAGKGTRQDSIKIRVERAQVQRPPSTCDLHKQKDESYRNTLCAENAPRIQTAGGDVKQLWDVCKVLCRSYLDTGSTAAQNSP